MLGFPGRKRASSTKGKPEIRPRMYGLPAIALVPEGKTRVGKLLCCTTDSQAKHGKSVHGRVSSRAVKQNQATFPAHPTFAYRFWKATTENVGLHFVHQPPMPLCHCSPISSFFIWTPSPVALFPRSPSPSKLEYLVSRAKDYPFLPSSIARTTDNGEKAKSLRLRPKAYGILQMMSIRPLA